jgi:DNA-binding MarR family transcriptional regulator
MERALTSLLCRERRHEVYAGLACAAGVTAAPRAAWLLLRVGQHPGMSRRDLARLLQLTDAGLQGRLAELVSSGYVAALPDDLGEPVPLTEAGQRAFGELFQARHERIARLAADWHPDQHPALLELLDRLTHQLAASREPPGRDLDGTQPSQAPSPAARRFGEP